VGPTARLSMLYPRRAKREETRAKTRGLFSTKTEIYAPLAPPSLFYSRIISSSDFPGGTNGSGPLIVGLVVLTVGLCLGGPSGYAINPARDLGPRIFGAMVGSSGLFAGAYWIVAPIIGPLLGGAIGVLTYDWFVTPYLPKKS